MEQIRNLYEVWQYCQQFIKQRMNQIDNFPSEDLACLYEQANQYIREETYRLANELGIIGINDVQMHGIYKKNAFGKCYYSGHIVFSFSILFYLDYIGVQSVIIHELCHIVHQNHKKDFWVLYESCIRKVGIIDNEYNGWDENSNKKNNPFMYRTPMKCVIHSSKYGIIRKKLFYGRSYVMSDRLPIHRPRSSSHNSIHYGYYQGKQKQEYIHDLIKYLIQPQGEISLDLSDLQFLKDEDTIYCKEYLPDSKEYHQPMANIVRQIKEEKDVKLTDFTSCIVCIEMNNANKILMSEMSKLLQIVKYSNTNLSLIWTCRNGVKVTSCKVTLVLS